MGPQQNQSDQGSNFFWAIILFVSLGLGAWFLDRNIFIAPVFAIRSFEIHIINFFSYLWNPIAAVLHLPAVNMQPLLKLQKFIQHADYSTVTFVQFKATNRFISSYTSYPIAVILFSLGGLLYALRNNAQFSHVYSMASLRKEEAKEWPSITPILSINLVKKDIDKGPWAMAQTPLMFSQKNQLIYPGIHNNVGIWAIHRAPTLRVFTLQLGKLWTGIDDAPIYVKALVVIFIARAQRQRDISAKYLGQISASAASGKLDFTGVEEQIQRYKNSKLLQWAAEKHAYTLTLMPTLLEISRSDGVLASAEFLWLKPVDRSLWYMLNSVGRQTAVVEVAGPFAHWRAEKKLQRAIKTPMMSQAVVALEGAMQEQLREEEGLVWHSNAD